jgi:hypothetical protein
MAGVKITDLTPITSAASDDLLYIVDVSDTSQSPEGTSKQIEVGNMFSSGSYTPTASAETNLTTLPRPSTFIRVGNIVNAFVLIDITLDVAEDTGSFDLSLPVATTFTDNKQLQGIIQWSKDGNPLAEITAINIISNNGNTNMSVTITTANDNAILESCVIAFQYEII